MKPPPAAADLTDISTETFNTILKILKSLRGFNLDIYKDKCAKRRIAIRISKTNCSSAAEYGDLLMMDEAEPDFLIKVLTIHVSHFFRNPPAFQKLKDEVLPYLFSLPPRQDREALKFWSAGCAGGEEPYTVALILRDSFADSISRRQVSILGTDVDSEVLERAKAGVYAKERLVEVPAGLLNRWFEPKKDRFQLAPEIMDMVIFERGDLFDTHSFPESDLILCRNVLIYLEREHQEKILNGFADALRSGGILILGKAETLVGESRRRFQTICPVERIYRVV